MLKGFVVSTAVSTTDYVAQITVLNFKPCDSVKCIDVTLKDDCIVEEVESFDLLLTTPSHIDERVIVDSGNSRMIIIDDDSMRYPLMCSLLQLRCFSAYLCRS